MRDRAVKVVVVDGWGIVAKRMGEKVVGEMMKRVERVWLTVIRG